MLENNINTDTKSPYRRIFVAFTDLSVVALGFVAGLYLFNAPQNNTEYVRMSQNQYPIIQGAVSEESLVDDRAEAVATCMPNQWVINKAVSTLSFEAVQYGQKFSGSFDFDGEIIFNPEKLDESYVNIDIDINSIATGSLTRDEQARTQDWFDVGAFPKANFKSSAFTKSNGDGEYIAHGVLELRGVAVPLDLPFSLRFSEEMPNSEEVKSAKTNVEMMAQISISLSDFGIGQVEGQSDDVISDKVDVFIVLRAERFDALL
jgi:polyisoprenoid-binding protein YceI